MTVNQLLPGKFMWSYFRIASSALLLVAALTTVAAAQITPSQDAYTDTAHPTTELWAGDYSRRREHWEFHTDHVYPV